MSNITTTADGVGIMAKKRTRKGTADPLVPVYSPKVRAAMEDSGIRLTDLARKLKTSPQAVAYLAEGEGTRRCRASRRSAIAKILKVSDAWLGEPTATLTPLWLAGINVTVGAGLFTSPRTQLAFSRLLEKSMAATDRDVRDRALRDAGIKENAAPEAVRENVAACIRQLTDLGAQRRDVLVGAMEQFMVIPVAGGMLTTSPHHPLNPDEADAGADLMSAWEQMLGPWFSGKLKMNYRRLSERAGFPVPAGERRSDTNPFIIVSPKGA